VTNLLTFTYLLIYFRKNRHEHLNLTDVLLKSANSERSHDKPQLESAKPFTERYLPVLHAQFTRHVTGELIIT